MFNIGGMELLLILLVAFLIVGPKDLPKVARWIARMVKKARAYVNQFKDELGLDELEKELKETRDELTDVMKEADVSEDVRAAQDAMRAAAEGLDYEVRKSVKDVKDNKPAEAGQMEV